MKVKNRQKLICTLYDKQKYVLDIKTLQQKLYHKLILKKVHGIIKFRQKHGWKIIFIMNNDLRKNAKNDFESKFFKLMNNSVFGKTIEKVRKHHDIKLVMTDKTGESGLVG